MIDGEKIVDQIGNGIVLLDKDLNVFFWNRWLEIHSSIAREEIVGKNIQEFFPQTSFDLLRRKIRIALTIQSSTFIDSEIDKYIIPFKLNQVTGSIYTHMRQTATISANGDGHVMVLIYDSTSIMAAKAVITEQLAQLERLATVDTLTGIYNRQKFNERYEAEFSRAKRYGCNFSLIIYDIDHFKSVNDNYGHLVGDTVLREMSANVAQQIRRSDLFARWGGEEFIILLPETNLQGAAIAAEKIRVSVEKQHFEEVGRKTCSFGVAEYLKGCNNVISLADMALYHAKNNGRNQVVLNDHGSLIVVRS